MLWFSPSLLPFLLFYLSEKEVSPRFPIWLLNIFARHSTLPIFYSFSFLFLAPFLFLLRTEGVEIQTVSKSQFTIQIFPLSLVSSILKLEMGEKDDFFLSKFSAPFVFSFDPDFCRSEIREEKYELLQRVGLGKMCYECDYSLNMC